MEIWDVLTMIGGLCLFLFGMNVMGEALERRAGNRLHSLLGKLTTKKMLGFLTGLGVTAIIQSSSATTVMVVGFVNSGLMNLGQAINVIMGANVGTTVTAWILSLSGISGENFFIQMLKPTSFTPILALVGVVLYVFCKGSKKKDTGLILLGFATLMFGMDAMSGAVEGLKNEEWFVNLFMLFENPVLAMLAGAILTAIIQSSSASVGILQALSMSTGAISLGAAIPIIMGQNIGTCVTALLSSAGANKNAKRAAVVHLSFNVIGTVVWLTAFSVVRAFLPHLSIFSMQADGFNIAIAHSVFNVLCVLLLLPMSRLLEKLANLIVRDSKQPEEIVELDERLLATPAVALEQCHAVANEMADIAVASLGDGIRSLSVYDATLAAGVRDAEDKTDHYEDVIGTYLVKLSTYRISDRESAEATKLLKIIGDFERISDHAVNLLESAEELRDKELSLSEEAGVELTVLCNAVTEILSLARRAFCENDLQAARDVEPLEQVVDEMKERLRTSHIRRLQQGGCSIEVGFVWSDLLTNLERVADHCSNIAACVLDAAEQNLNLHATVRTAKTDSAYFKEKYAYYAGKYLKA